MIPIWLDCDPGHDDAVAILLAAKLPAFKLLGISTVFGNAPLEKTTVNAMAVLKAIGEDGVRVYSGASKIQSCDVAESRDKSGDLGSTDTAESTAKTEHTPASEPSKSNVDPPSSHVTDKTDQVTHPTTHVTPLDHYENAPSDFAPSIHGESGLDGTSLLPEITCPVKADLEVTLVAMATAIRSNPGTCLVATGSLTNVKALFERFPDVKSHVTTLSIMGGGFGVGNWTPYAEFNIWCDSEAARWVFSDDVLSSKIILCPLNVTHTAIATENVLSQLKGVGGHVSQMFFELMTFFRDTYETEFGFVDGPPVHDPLSVAVLLPGIVTKQRRVGVEVEVEGDKRGMLEEKAGHVTVVEEVDLDKFWGLVLDALKRAS
ncbi:hypothetical protein CJU89_2950 [Yarrowia sp. B02]|nr:hypothetical protein CJU89_2950 [Yarrowia sp. B02]